MDSADIYLHCTEPVCERHLGNRRGLGAILPSVFSGPVALLPTCLINYLPSHEDVWRSGGIASPFLTSALVGSEWSASRLGRFTLREDAAGAHKIGG
jgi:hypothetical protein